MANFNGTEGDDTYTGTPEGDTIVGNGGNDTLNGAGGQDLIDGGDGNDALDGGTGADILRGAAGNDWYIVDDAGDQLVEQEGNGGDVVWSYVSYALSDHIESLVLKGDAAINGTASAQGSWILGNDASNHLFGRDGNDTLNGAGGSDVLEGGNGNDVYYVDASPDLIVEDEDGGSDMVIASVSHTLAANVETLILAPELAINGTGNGLANFVNGNDFGNVLNGAGGDDILMGTLGADTLTGGSGADTFEDSAAGLNGDTITDFAIGDRIIIRDVSFEDFSFSLSGSTLTFTGGSLTLAGGLTGRLVASVHPFYNNGATGVQLVLAEAPNDFNGDGRSDILWRHDDGLVTDWLAHPNGSFASNYATLAASVPVSWQVAGTGDFNGDNRADILWRHADGTLTNWLGQANGGFADNYANAATMMPADWQVVGTGDFNGDGKADILWRNEDGTITNWKGEATGSFVSNHANVAALVPTDWDVVGTGDFNGDGKDDILWRHTDGTITNWLGQDTDFFGNNYGHAAALVSTNWAVVGIGDFNGDSRADILWRNETGLVTNWLGEADGGFADNYANAAVGVPAEWHVVQIGDFNGDGNDDILWRHDDGLFDEWLGSASGALAHNPANVGGAVPTDWQVQATDIQLV